MKMQQKTAMLRVRRHRPSNHGALVATLFAGTCLAGPALAQAGAPARTAGAAATAPALEEIVVTARKKEELLLDVPIAVSAVSAQTIERSNVQNFTDVAKLTPSLFNQQTSSGRQDRFVNVFVIRGLNLNTFSSSGNPVLLFVDGAPVLSGDMAGFDDIERIEVLRGPQSAYFGRNTFAGAINVVTKDPAFDYGGRVRAEWATHETSAVGLELEGPLIPDKLAFRLSGRYRDEGGDYKNPAGGRLGARKTQAVSLSLLAKPLDGLKVKLFGEYARFDDGPAASGKLFGSQLTCAQPVQNWICGDVGTFPRSSIGANADIYPEFRALMDRVSIYDNQFLDQGGLAKRSKSAHAVVTYDLPAGITASSITAYHKSIYQQVSDEDSRDTRAIPNPNYPRVPNVQPFFNNLFFVERYVEDFSQELRFTSDQDQRLRWAVGANYVHVDALDSNVAGALSNFVGFFSNTGVTKVSTPSVFGAVYFDLTDTVTANVEAREQWDKVKVVPGPGLNLEKTFKSFSPRLSLQYQPDDWTNFFVAWARGYRPGNFNARLLTLPASAVSELVAQTGAGVAVDQEQLDQAEIGLKKKLFDNRAEFSFVAYAGRLKGQQVQSLASYRNASNVPVTIALITNIGRTDFWGLEFEGAMAVSQDLTVNATWALNDTEIKSYVCLTCAGITGSSNVNGNRLPGVPKYTASLYATYTQPLAGDYEWFFRPEYFYTGSSYATEANLASTGARHEVNLRAGIQSDAIRLEAYVRNLFNDKTPLSITRGFDPFNTARGSIAVPLPPLRQVGIRASYNF